MPYISKKDDRREKLRAGDTAQSAGELNYQIFYYIKHRHHRHDVTNSKIFIKSMVDNFLGENPNYQKYNDMSGCLMRCSREVERRLDCNSIVLYEILDSYDREIAEYEDIKIEQNGDVE